MSLKRSHIPILILAAGASSRLGSPKQLLMLNQQTLLQKAIATALEVSESVGVILGANKDVIQPTINNQPVHFIYNEKWSEGLSSSIHSGIVFLENFFEEKKPRAVLIMLCDQPFVDVFLLKKIITTFESIGKPIVASQYNNQPGVPALFGFSFFEKLKNLNGDKGAKALINQHLEDTEFIVFEKGKFDIDTKDDFDRLKNQYQ